MIAAPILAALHLFQAAPEQALGVQLYPVRPLIERTRLGQAVNFDFEITNPGTLSLELTAIRAAVRDTAGQIVQRLEVNDNGGLPGIQTVPNRTWKPGESHTVPNPFHTLSMDIPLGRMDFEFAFRDGSKQTLIARAQVRPGAYLQKTKLIMPMPGRVLVWDGHDFYSHHRRWNFSHPTVKRLGLLSNPGRYSLDLVIADADGRFHSEAPQKREDYFSYGAMIVAPGDGIVVAMENAASNEPAEPTAESFKRDPMVAIYGNYLVIDHGNGEFSQLGHLKQGSVLVRAGERVRRGQPIAQAGASGTSLFPHLHYQLVDSPGINGEGLPARFSDVNRVLGGTKMLEEDAWVDSGDIVETPGPAKGNQ